MKSSNCVVLMVLFGLLCIQAYYMGWITDRNWNIRLVYELANKYISMSIENVGPILERDPLIRHINCTAIIEGDKEAIKSMKNEKFRKAVKRMVIPDEEVSKWASNCASLRTERRYIARTGSEEERDYPLAYIISTYRSLQSFEHLLRSIYHPQNIYCIHIDQKSDKEFQKGIKKIAECFDNVFLPSKMTEVYYKHWSIVQASLNCMEDLVRREYQWKYVMNLCVFDHPITTNLETVRMLKALNGINAVTSFTFKKEPYKRIRYIYRFTLPKKMKSNHGYLIRTSIKKSPPPHNITLFTGADYVALKREAVDFMLNDPEVQDFFEWSKDTAIPDELVWSTVQRMYPKFPGSVPGDFEYDFSEDDSLPRFRTWSHKSRKCEGQYLREICVYGSGDLQRIVKEKHLFANKLSFDVDPVAVECLAEHVRNKTLRQRLVRSTNFLQWWPSW